MRLPLPTVVAFVLALGVTPPAVAQSPVAPSPVAPSPVAPSPVEPSAAVPSPTRVFFSRMQTGAGVSESDGRIVADAVLVAARTRVGFDVVGVSDLQSVMDLEASKQAAGCDVVSCASEIADALGAPELVTGQLGRVGETWVITLTRLDRASLRVLAREQAQREGAGADAIFADVPGLVERLLPNKAEVAGPSLQLIGAATAGVGAVAVVLGAVLVIASATIHQEGVVAFDEGRFVDAKAAADTGEPVYLTGWTVAIVGAAALAVGAGILVLDTEEAP